MSWSARDTERIAARFARTLRGGEVLLLSGELGAGKTVFVRGLARALGVRGRITSPTFVLMRVYRATSAKLAPTGASGLQATSAWRRHHSKCRRLAVCSCQLVARFVHVDAYRAHDPRELEAIGLDEWVGRPDAVVVIEWGERVASLFHASHRITIASSPEHRDTRRITITQSRIAGLSKNLRS